MTRRRMVALLAATTATTLVLMHVAPHHRHDTRFRRVATSNVAAASTAAVQLLHALTDDDATQAPSTITATTTPDLGRALLDARQRTQTVPRARLLVTSTAAEVSVDEAVVRVAGQLLTTRGRVAVAWTVHLAADRHGRWCVVAVA